MLVGVFKFIIRNQRFRSKVEEFLGESVVDKDFKSMKEVTFLD